LEESVQRTTRWAKRCKDGRKEGQLLFGIPQGGTDLNLRRRSAKELTDVGFDGYGIGGLSIGEPREDMVSAINASISTLSPDSPKHMMGVGSPAEILESITMGVDILDSAYPTRNARHGTFNTNKGRQDIRKSQFMSIEDSLDEECGCSTCEGYSTSYIHHLFKEKEMLAYRLLSIHNLSSVLALLSEVRKSIKEERFSDFKKRFLSDVSF
jgi:queuine tRNA-ribosyltransferase